MTDPADTATAAVAELVAQRDAAQGDLAESETERAADQRNHDAAVAGLEATIAELRVKLDEATAPWEVLHEYDLTRDEGWQINSGPRPSVDFSRGRKEMVSFAPEGLRLSAKREGDLILSCDIIAKFKPLPVFRAIEMDIEFAGDPLGPGAFPAPYWSKAIEGGGGEFDGVEHMGALAGTDMQWKMTAIALPAGSPLVQVQKALVPFFKANRINPAAKNTWRWEHTDGKIELFINGLSAATITREEFDGPGPYNKDTKKPYWEAKPGRFNAMFQNPALHPYVRSTWQVGPRADGRPGGMGGIVPANWTGSSFLISRMVAYVPRG